uniref:BTB domain-containing protein n=1 Tax=Timema cristinae TaxID=61476 RepID=A0A7R9H5F0_TIMCR|nr:unnamed protein product [Timema cristinae]
MVKFTEAYTARLAPLLRPASPLVYGHKIRLFLLCVMSILLYSAPVFSYLPRYRYNHFRTVYHRFLRLILGAPPRVPNRVLLTMSGLPSLDSRIRGLAVRFFTRAQASSNMIVRGIGDYDAPGHPYRRIRDGVVNPFVDVGRTPDRDSNLDLPVIGSLVYCESSALDHAATEAGYFLFRKMSVTAIRDEQMAEGWRTSPNTSKPPLPDPRFKFFDWLVSPMGEDGVEIYDENKEKILKKLKSLLESGDKSDVTFLVGKKEEKPCRAHKLILSLRSPVFDTMCFGPMAENKEIVVPDIEPETFHKLLYYIYTNSVSLTDVESSCELLYAAKKYMCDGLVEECRKNISYLLDSNNVCSVFETMIDLDEQELMYYCLNVIRQKTSEVIKHPSFLNLRKETLEILLGEDYLSVDSELDLLDAALRWTARRCDVEGLEVNAVNKRRIMRPFLKKIVFLSLSSRQFVSATVLRDILTAEEYRDIISNIVESNSCALPPGFCAKLSRRCNFCFNGSPRAMKKNLGFCPHCNLQSCCSISVTYNAKQCHDLNLLPVEKLVPPIPPVEELEPSGEEIDSPQWRSLTSRWRKLTPTVEEFFYQWSIKIIGSLLLAQSWDVLRHWLGSLLNVSVDQSLRIKIIDEEFRQKVIAPIVLDSPSPFLYLHNRDEEGTILEVIYLHLSERGVGNHLGGKNTPLSDLTETQTLISPSSADQSSKRVGLSLHPSDIHGHRSETV